MWDSWGKSRDLQQALGQSRCTGSETTADVFAKVRVLQVAPWHSLDPGRAVCFGTDETETCRWLPWAWAVTSLNSLCYLSSKTVHLQELAQDEKLWVGH